jgi:hypothetical protein
VVIESNSSTFFLFYRAERELAEKPSKFRLNAIRRWARRAVSDITSKNGFFARLLGYDGKLKRFLQPRSERFCDKTLMI